MTTFLPRLLAVAGVASALACHVHAAEPAIITKARALVGSDGVLNNVKTVRFSGTLTQPDPADRTKQIRTAVEIIFQKPDQQRIMATTDRMIEVTALDGYEAWMRRQDAADADKWNLTLLGPEQIKRLRANTWESLSFFRGIEKLGGRVEEQGTHTIEGITCQKIAFIHAPNIIFYRFFDVATGRLVLTETESGGTIREQGDMMANGIRFPRTIINASKNSKGEIITVTINFDKVTVNEPVPTKEFAVPGLRVK